MGKKTLVAAMGVSAASVVFCLLCLFLEFHKLRFALAVGGPVYTLTTYLLKVTSNVEKANAFCYGLKQAATLMSLAGYDAGTYQENFFCNSNKTQTPQEVAMDWCPSAVVMEVCPQVCTGMKAANFAGICFVILSVINIVLQVASIGITYQYVSLAPKKKYREVALVLHSIGFGLVALCQMIYLFSVLSILDSVKIQGIAAKALKVPEGTGYGIGWILNWVTMLMQLVVVVLVAKGKSGDEARYQEAREHDKFVNELEMSAGQFAGAGAAGGYAGQAGGNYGGTPLNSGYSGQPGYGYPAAPQPAFGLGMQTSAPPPGWGAPPPAMSQGGPPGQGPPYF